MFAQKHIMVFTENNKFGVFWSSAFLRQGQYLLSVVVAINTSKVVAIKIGFESANVREYLLLSRNLENTATK